MSLLQLPPETLIQIFNYVDSSYFRSDLSRLTVCRQWSKYAHTACFRELYITQRTLRRLMSAPRPESSLPLLKDSVEILKLDLKGFEDWNPVRLSGYGIQTVVDEAWTTQLNNDLLSLATTLMERSRKVRFLRIKATSELDPGLSLPERRNYLFESTISAFLSASNLTNLELDLCGTELIPQHSRLHHGEKLHVCTSIAALLSTLRRLRLRMRTICSEVLNPHQKQYGVDLLLNEVLINLSLTRESPLIISAGHANCCDSSYSGGVLQLKADMKKQMQALVAHMAAPKVVRILMHALPSGEMRAFDVLRDKTVRLEEGAEWDDDGEIIEEKVEDEESEISSVSSDDDG